MNQPWRLSLERLQRLRPSDIEKIRSSISRPDRGAQIAEVFRRYLAFFKAPIGATEWDDIICITLQLREAGFWEFCSFADFVASSRGIQPEALQIVAEALGEEKWMASLVNPDAIPSAGPFDLTGKASDLGVFSSSLTTAPVFIGLARISAEIAKPQMMIGSLEVGAETKNKEKATETAHTERIIE